MLISVCSRPPMRGAVIRFSVKKSAKSIFLFQSQIPWRPKSGVQRVKSFRIMEVGRCWRVDFPSNNTNLCAFFVSSSIGLSSNNRRNMGYVCSTYFLLKNQEKTHLMALIFQCLVISLALRTEIQMNQNS